MKIEMNDEQIVTKLFDYQKFEQNLRLKRMIKEAEDRGEELFDDDLRLVNAAGVFELQYISNIDDIDRE